ncbi:MAG: hypothetical protein PVI40_03075 [Chlamydiota bacterium]
MKIASVINYCTNEYRFLKSCVEEALKFSEQVLITVCDHFFDGSPEDLDALEQTFSEFPNCQFLFYPYILDKVPKKLLKKIGDNFCCTFSRAIGFSCAKKDIDYLLFLDTDEIVESDKFKSWLKVFPISQFDAVRLSNYWYFRESKYRAKTWEDSVVMVRKKALSRKILLQEGDRFACFNHVKGKTKRHCTGQDNCPFIHHYSWVRTKGEMLKKVTTWGHRKERNWVDLVEEEFSREFNGIDFIHGYEFEEVDPFVKIDVGKKVQKKSILTKKNVYRISERELFTILGKGFQRFLPLTPPIRKDLI